ncbi:MAG: T9SS type A sorting domain-containing protein [Bacteroidota bacterium]
MKYLISLVLCCCLCMVQGQNLVPNPSFEIYDTCPSDFSEILNAVPWFRPTIHVSNISNDGTPDYYNSCIDTTNLQAAQVGVPQNFLGYEFARTGHAYAGFYSTFWCTTNCNYREYIEVKLDSALVAGITYYVSFYVSLADSCSRTTDAVGAYISIDSILSNIYHPLPYIPQINNPVGNFITDKINWTKISGTFLAQGGEQFITIGNFKNDTLTDTIFVSGGGRNHYDTSFDKSAYFYIDDVCISLDSMTCLFSTYVPIINYQNEIEIYPNPSNSTITIHQAPVIPNQQISFLDVLGNKIYSCPLNNSTETILDISHWSNGIYFYQINNPTNTSIQQLVGKFIKQ